MMSECILGSVPIDQLAPLIEAIATLFALVFCVRVVILLIYRG